MVLKGQFEKKVREIYEKIRSHREPYGISILGIDIIVLPDVFSPKYFTDSEWYAKEAAEIVGAGSLLEIGTGTGILLATMIIYQMYEQITEQHMDDMHPFLRRMLGKL